MIVDDNVDFALLLKCYLLKKECEVRIVHSLHQALQRDQTSFPQLIILSPELINLDMDKVEKLRMANPGADVLFSGEDLLSRLDAML